MPVTSTGRAAPGSRCGRELREVAADRRALVEAGVHQLPALAAVARHRLVLARRAGQPAGDRVRRMRGAEAGVVHSLAGPRILVPAGVADQCPAWAGGRAHPVRLGRATLGAADGDGRADPRHQPGMGLEPPGELGVGRGAEAGEGGSGRAQADACDAAVGREDVGHLVAVQGELGGVRRLAVRSAPLGDVAVVQRPQGLDRALHRRRHLAGHGGVAAVRADHDPAADVDLAATLGQPDAADPVAVAQQRPDGCRLRHLDGRASARPLQE